VNTVNYHNVVSSHFNILYKYIIYREELCFCQALIDENKRVANLFFTWYYIFSHYLYNTYFRIGTHTTFILNTFFTCIIHIVVKYSETNYPTHKTTQPTHTTTIIIIIIYRIYTAAPRALFACVYNALFCRIRNYNNGPWRMVEGCVEVRRFKWTAIVLEGFRAFRSIYQWRLPQFSKFADVE